MTQDNFLDKVEVRKEYYESGALWVETPYVDGNKHGIEKRYYESGALDWEVPYVDGKKHGIERVYYPSGALREETPYANGKRHGIAKTYDEDEANIVCLTYYDNGQNARSIKFDTYGDQS